MYSAKRLSAAPARWFHLFLIWGLMTAAVAETYYVDSVGGNDANPGTHPAAAWKTLEKAGSQVLQPGDSLLFRSGQRFVGTLDVKGSGREGNIITVGKYGGEARPIIDGNGISGTTDKQAVLVRLRNIEYVTVQDLEITSDNGERAFVHAIQVSHNGEVRPVLRHIRIRNCYIHNIPVSKANPSNSYRDKNLGGIVVGAWGPEPVSYDDIIIENNVLEKNGRVGIVTGTNFANPFEKDENYSPLTNVIIRGNHISHTEGDGIILSHASGAVVERNVVHHCGGVTTYSVGIWSWSSENTLFQFNESYANRDPKSDGQGFDVDFHCRGTIFQYNYSHDNEGGFLLVMRDDAKRGNRNRDIIVRYNVSINDRGSITHHKAGKEQNLWFYNNTVITDHRSKPTVTANRFFNNIIYQAAGDSPIRVESGAVESDYNAYFTANGAPQEPNSVYADPKIMGLPVDAETGKIVAPVGIKNVAHLFLHPDSPCLGKGKALREGPEFDFAPVRHDFSGAPLDADTPFMGAFGPAPRVTR